MDEAEDDQLDVSELVKRYDNAVVFITTYDVLGEKTGSGTGCVLSSDGLVATSYHVLADAATAEAQLKDGETITLSGYRQQISTTIWPSCNWSIARRTWNTLS